MIALIRPDRLPGLLVAAAGLSSALVGCSGESGNPSVLDSAPEDRPERRVVRSGWDTVFSVGGTIEDTTLLHPTIVGAGGGGVALYDAGRKTLMRFGRDGELQWRFGNEGAGPDEFLRVRDLEVDGDGRSWTLDPENDRITVLSPAGEVLHRIGLDRVDPRAESLVPLGAGRAILFVLDRKHPRVIVDTAGTVVDRLPFPWDGFQRLPTLATQVETDRASDGNGWAVAFSMGDGFFGFRGDRQLDYHGWYVEPVPFPRVETSRSEDGNQRSVTRRIADPNFAARAIGVEAGRIAVLFAGESQHQNRIVDLYGLQDGRYHSSLLLPRKSTDIDVSSGVVYAIYQNPVPGLIALRRETRSSSPSSSVPVGEQGGSKGR